MLREAELHLTSQQTVALAADQRALTFVGLQSAAVVVLVGASSQFLRGDQPSIALGVICILVAFGLMIAVYLALRTAAPGPFDFAGSSPQDWVSDIEQGKPFEASLAEQCQNHAEAIHSNHARMEKHGRVMWIALRTAVGTIAIGGLAFVLALVLA